MRLMNNLFRGLDFAGDLMTPCDGNEPWYFYPDKAQWYICWTSPVTGIVQRIGPMPYRDAYRIQNNIVMGVAKWLERLPQEPS